MALNSYAQQFYVGAKTQIGSARFLNEKQQIYGLSIHNASNNTLGVNYRYYPDNSSYYTGNIGSISAELAYNVTTINFMYLGNAYPYTFKSFEIPVMWNIRNEDWGLYGELGLNYSYTIRQKYNSVLPIKFNRNNLFGVVGFGFDNKLSNTLTLTIGARGSYNVLDATKNINNIKLYSATRIARWQAIVGLSYYIHYYHDNH